MSSLTGDLAWPGVLIVVILLFRAQISRILERVKALTWRDLRIELDASTIALEHAELLRQQVELTRTAPELSTGIEQTGEEPTPPQRANSPVKLTEEPLVDHPLLENWDALRVEVLTDPKFAIHLAGEVLDGVTRKVVGKPHPFGSLAITKSMQQNPRIPSSLVDGIFQLQRYRNLVEGNIETIVAVHDAYNFIDNVEKAIYLLESALGDR